jgi:ATPase subunit of ABC transporter with duplicated ATPase domains
MILTVNITEKSFTGAKTLLSGVNFAVDDHEKVGLIGRNGVGKTTLFGILSGDDTDFAGEIIFRKGTITAKTAQEHSHVTHETTVEYILGGLPEFAKLDRIITTYPEMMGENVRKITEFTEALQRFDDLGYYQIREKVERELQNFQLEHYANTPFTKLSGGQKRLAEIVKIMRSHAHLVLVDEPTNHMDFVAKQQFIDWLDGAEESVLVITHDRDVLRHVDRIIEIKDGEAVSYRGNYDDYLRQNAHSTSADMNDYQNAQRQLENAKKKVIQFRRLKEKARDPDTIKQFKRREIAAEQEVAELAAVEKPSFWIDRDSAAQLGHKESANYAKFKAKNIRLNTGAGEKSRSTHVLVKTENLSLGYAAPLFSDVNFELRENEAIELRGRNGAGKTTLLKAILGSSLGSSDAKVFGGELVLDKDVSSGKIVGVYEQEISTDFFDLPLSLAIEKIYLSRKLPISDQKIKQLMSDYLFDPILDANTPLKQLSGGQKARFQLIKMLAGGPQLLILDEPTNHLDLPSIEELEIALAKFSGAILYVSHDNYFREKLGGRVIEISMQ